MARIKPAPAPLGQVRNLAAPLPGAREPGAPGRKGARPQTERRPARPRPAASRTAARVLRCLGLLLGVAASAGCRSDAARCQGQGSTTGGAVVVRWRVLDYRSGRLFPRGQCCCSPLDVSGAARDQCLGSGGSLGSDCPDAPGWRIPQVRLRIRRLAAAGGAGVDGGGADDDYSIDTDCTAAERTTEFCLPPGPYELSLTAQAQRLLSSPDLGDGTDPGVTWGTPATLTDARVVAPAAVQRNVQAGQIVNLDVVVLGVNASQPPP